MRIADHPKKLGLLLLPLIPLTAIGIVEVVQMATGGNQTCACTSAPVIEEGPHCMTLEDRLDVAPPAPTLQHGPKVAPPA